MDHILFGVCLKFVRGVSTGTLLVAVVVQVYDEVKGNVQTRPVQKYRALRLGLGIGG